jgi:5-dehydro-4-deoxyglucarate dehydratase
MRAFMTPPEVQARLAPGMLCFPVTDFDASGEFDQNTCTRRLDWLAARGAAALFMAGGAGEFFSLTPSEYAALIKAAVSTCGGKLPVIAAAGYGTRTAIAYAEEAERLGADGLLLLPPYLVEGTQEGLGAHIAAVCRATSLAVIVYNRANCRLTVDTLAHLAEECPNLIGFKDGVGDLEQLTAARSALGNRLIFINGMPTAEVYARAYRGVGIHAYSSAVFNFMPKVAHDFHRALRNGDAPTVDSLLQKFFVPYVRIRQRQPGYAVSIVKAGVKIVGRSAGSVRPPLSDLTESEYRELKRLIEALGPQDQP